MNNARRRRNNVRFALIAASAALDVIDIFIPRDHPLKRPVMGASALLGFAFYGVRVFDATQRNSG